MHMSNMQVVPFLPSQSGCRIGYLTPSPSRVGSLSRPLHLTSAGHGTANSYDRTRRSAASTAIDHEGATTWFDVSWHVAW